jgi:hypothetical protein
MYRRMLEVLPWFGQPQLQTQTQRCHLPACPASMQDSDLLLLFVISNSQFDSFFFSPADILPACAK